MKNSFYLRKSKSETGTLIMFSCYFNQEKKKFVYSTQKSILPLHWDFENKRPNKSGKLVCRNQPVISKRLRDFEDAFQLIKSRSELGELEFDSSTLKEHFDKVFERVSTASSFFEVYDKFTQEKIKLKEWKKSTVKRYINIKNLLVEFEKVNNYKLTFSKINNKFFTDFTDFCYEYKNHYTNTFSRNVGLFKTFMIWSLKNGYAYNDSFKSFKKPQRVLTREEVLNLDQIHEISNMTFKTEHLQKVADTFVFQCLTGMRYGELKLINKRLITPSNCILLKEEKNSNKVPRLIPMSKLALSILIKYDYQLPLISNQKQNAAIKEVVAKIGLSHNVEYSRTKGVDQEIFIKPFYKRIGTHTARRSFITIMRNKGVPDKVIMSITGHTDIKSFNQYHQVDNTARINAVNSVFDNF
jgi:site-specific recombinase XerD